MFMCVLKHSSICYYKYYLYMYKIKLQRYYIHIQIECVYVYSVEHCNNESFFILLAARVSCIKFSKSPPPHIHLFCMYIV